MPTLLQDPDIFSAVAEEFINTPVDKTHLDFTQIQPVREIENGTIYSFPDKYNTNLTEDILVFEKTVILKQIEHKTGKTKTGKTWGKYKVKHTKIFSLKKEKNGISWLRVYSIQPRTKNSRGHFRDISSNLTEYKPAYLEEIYLNSRTDSNYYTTPATAFAYWVVYNKFKQLNPTVDVTTIPSQNFMHAIAYPAVKLFNFNNTQDLTMALRLNTKPWLHSATGHEFVKHAFGKKNIRKDVVKAVAQAKSAYSLMVSAQLSKHVPVDWLLPLIKSEQNHVITTYDTWESPHTQIVQLVRLLNQSTPAQQRKIINTCHSEIRHERNKTTMHYRDSMRALEDISDEMLKEEKHRIDYTSWETIHNTLQRIHRDAKMLPQPVPQNNMHGLLDGKTFTHENRTYTISSPKLNKELIDWGSQLTNCIATYANHVVTNRTTVFAVHTEDKKLYANMEIRNNKLTQFVTNYNMPVPVEMQQQVTKMITQVTAKKKRSKQLDKA